MAEVLKNKKPPGICKVQTDLIASMQALWKSAAEHRALFGKSPDAIVIVEGDKFVFANKAFLKVFACGRDRGGIGLTVTDHLTPHSHALTRSETFSRGPGKAVLGCCKPKARKKEKYFFDAELFVGPIISQEKIVRPAIIRDITQRKLVGVRQRAKDISETYSEKMLGTLDG
ncbi:MAG: hypothetical protein AMJ73_06005 [candidate division Zixibacteria bacterium SM1_73]|nr:MAG: hypothetical protein AMJ73_06005 [candidate division Zixibacteria bacterium SM1_73]